MALAGNPSIPKKLRLKIQEGKNVEIRKSLAGNPSLTEEELLAFCVDDEVQHRVVARDGVLPVPVIKSLVEHGSAYTREQLAWGYDLDKESLLQLAQDTEADVRTAVVYRWAQDPDVCRVMVEDEDPSIKASARRGLIRAGRMTPEEIIEILEAELEGDTPRQESCALNIAAECDLGEEALQLVLKSDLQVISHLRYNKNLDKKLLERLAATGESEVIREIANDRLSFPAMIEKHCASILEILKTEYGVGSHLPDLTERDCIRCSMDGEGLLWVEFCADMGSFRVEYQEQKKGKPFVEIT